MSSVFPSARAALLCAGLAALAVPSARGQGVTWLTDYNVARREAHDKNRPLVIDFSTDNCVYCRKLEATTLRDPAVAQLVSDHFVALHVHVGAGGGADAASLAQTLGIKGFPTLIFADPNGKVVAREDGYVEAAAFTQTAQRVLAGLAPTDAAVQQAVRLTAPPSDGPSPNAERARRAGELLAQAQADYREQHYLECRERCQALQSEFADRPESAEARRMEDKIRTDPEMLRLACDSLTDRLGALYLERAEAFVQQGQPQKAIQCLEWVTQACPGTPVAETAKGRLGQLRDRVAKTAP